MFLFNNKHTHMYMLRCHKCRFFNAFVITVKFDKYCRNTNLINKDSYALSFSFVNAYTNAVYQITLKIICGP